MPTFTPDVVSAVLAHMNSDHLDDNLVIVRAFADSAAATARMTGFDGSAGHWVYDEGRTVSIPWSTDITERAEVRREIVALHDEALRRLAAHRPEAQ